MANIKSAKKRVLVAERNHEKNVAFKTSIKTALKKALALAEKGKTFETPGLYKDEELLKVGSKQGAAILNNLKIKTIKFNVDLNTLLTSAYPFS